MRPETRYARSGDVHVAYQTVGDGPIDVLFVDQWWSNVDSQWDVPPLAQMALPALPLLIQTLACWLLPTRPNQYSL